MARAAHGAARAIRRDGHGRDGGEDLLGVALVDEHVLQRGQHAVDVRAAQGQRPPRHAQADAERRLVGAVAADVADHQVHGAVARLDEVVEVAAQQRALATRPVAGADEQRAVVEDRHRQQPALQARGLLGQDLGRPQPLADAVGLAALDGVEDRPPQAVAVDAALDEVVLGAGRDRLDAALVVAVAGEHEVRDVRRRLAQALSAASPLASGRPRSSRTQSNGSPRRSSSPSVSDCARRTSTGAPSSRRSSETRKASPWSSSIMQHANEVACGQACVRWSGRRRRRHDSSGRGPGGLSLSEPCCARVGRRRRARRRRASRSRTARGRRATRAWPARAR